MGMHLFNAPILCNQCSRSLFPNTGNSRNIIRRIPHQRLDVNKFLRCHLIACFYILFQIVLDFRSGLFCLWYPDFYMFCCKLQKITVTGNHGNLHAFPLPGECKRSKQIVCLIPFFFHNADTHGSQHFFHQRNLFTQRIVHRSPCSLVAFKHFVAERRRMYVKRNRQIIRLFLFQNLK